MRHETPSSRRPTRAWRWALFTLALALPAVGAAAAEWRERAPLPMPRFEMATAVVDGELYVFGGFGPGVRATTRVDVYDWETDRWRRAADMPEALTHVNTAVDGDVVWLAGGFLDTGSGPAVDSVWRYDASEDRWSAGPALPAKRAGGGLAVLGRRLHYFGGLLPDRDTDTADHWVLDLDALEREDREWTSATPMPAPRNQFGVVVHQGKAYAIGGQFHHDSTLREPLDQPRVDVYDPENDRWSRVADLPGPLSHVEPGAFVAGGRLMVVGGRGAADGLQSRVLVHDPDGDAWRVLAELPNALLAPGARVLGDQLVVVGGALERYQAQTTTWALPLP